MIRLRQECDRYKDIKQDWDDFGTRLRQELNKTETKTEAEVIMRQEWDKTV